MNLTALKWGSLAALVLGLCVLSWHERNRADKAMAAYRIEAQERNRDHALNVKETIETRKELDVAKNRAKSAEKLAAEIREELTEVREVASSMGMVGAEALKAGDAATFDGVNVDKKWLDEAKASKDTLPDCIEGLGGCTDALEGCVTGIEVAQKRGKKWKTRFWLLAALGLGVGTGVAVAK